MSRVVSPSAGMPCELARVLRVWEIPRSSYYALQKKKQQAPPASAPRRGPKGPMGDEPLAEEIKQVLKQSPFHGEGYRKVWARLRMKAIRTSKRRVLRLMRENNLLAAVRVGKPYGPKAHDGTIRTERPDHRWGTDMTTTTTHTQGQPFVFVAVDHCTFECVGIHASASGNRFEALEPLRQGIRERFGPYREQIAAGLEIRHDHGSAYMSEDFQNELRFLGMDSSPAYVREPEGNGCAERFIRILKENLLWVRTSNTVEELRLALSEFMALYNSQ